jgi:hypothetical protein
MTARLAGWITGVIAALALAPIQGASVVDGDEEEWVKTVAGRAYRVPWDSKGTPWFPLALPIVGGLVVGFTVWAVVTLLRHPSDRQRTRAFVALAISLATLAVVAVIFALQPPSEYQHVF